MANTVRGQLELAPMEEEPPSRPLDGVLYHAYRVGLLLALAVVTYLLFPNAPAVDSPIFEVGSVATKNVIAPFAFTVPKTDEELTRERDELARSAKPIFDFSQAALDSAQGQLRTFMDSLASAAEREERTQPGKQTTATVSVAMQQAAAHLGVSLTPDEARDLLAYVQSLR